MREEESGRTGLEGEIQEFGCMDDSGVWMSYTSKWRYRVIQFVALVSEVVLSKS